MNITDIDHLEFYVGDAHQSAYYLGTAYGFRIVGRGGPQTGLLDQHSLLLRNGDIRIVLTTGIAPDHPATRYVSRHGDGVAIIAFGCDDVPATYAQITGRGATGLQPPTDYVANGERVTVALVPGFGDVTHRLVNRGTPDGAFLPGAFEPVADARPEDKLLDVVDHIAICVGAGELGDTSRYYQDVFDFSEIFEEYIDVGGQGMNSKVVQSTSRAITFTLIEPDVTRRPGQIDDFLQWHAGSGVQHVAFRTHDIVAAVRTFGGRGINFLNTPGAYYDSLTKRLDHIDLPIDDLRELGILVDSDHWGQMYQIFTESIHIRRTLFLELIERHGALTFGSSNIKALYEAKERELATPSDASRERADLALA